MFSRLRELRRSYVFRAVLALLLVASSVTAPQSQTAPVEPPSEQSRTYEPLSFVRITVPANWQETRGTNGALYAPAGGRVERNGAVDVTRGLEVGVFQSDNSELEKNIRAFANQIKAANKDMREQTDRDGSNATYATVQGRLYLRMFFTNVNATTGESEVVFLSATQLTQNRMLYLAATVPFRELEDYAVAVGRVRRSLQILDEETASQRPSPPTPNAQPIRQAKDIAGLWTGSRGIVNSEAREFRNWADGSFMYWPRVQDPNAKIFVFDFKPDGTYSFGYGAGGVVWTSHSGRYSVTRATDADSARYPFLLTLSPSPDTVRTNPARQPHQMPSGLGELEKGSRGFRLKDSSVDGLVLMDVSIRGRDVENDIGSFRIYQVH